MQRRVNLLNTTRYDRYDLQNCKAITRKRAHWNRGLSFKKFPCKGCLRFCNTKKYKSSIFFHSLKVASATILLLSFLNGNEKNLSNQKKAFLFHFKSSFCFWGNEILEFYIFKFYNVIKCLNMKREINFAE